MIEKVILENDYVRLEPVAPHHIDGIWNAGQFPELWKYMPIVVDSRDRVRDLIDFCLKMHAAGQALAFVTVDTALNNIVGSTGYWNADLANKRVEIGFTWITPKWQRTPVNTACKLLMLGHAFDKLQLNRVEFKTDALNTRSQAALERIGATREGTLRSHMIMPDGRLRDSVYFSILRVEWPVIKRQLEEKLASH